MSVIGFVVVDSPASLLGISTFSSSEVRLDRPLHVAIEAVLLFILIGNSLHGSLHVAEVAPALQGPEGVVASASGATSALGAAATPARHSD